MKNLKILSVLVAIIFASACEKSKNQLEDNKSKNQEVVENVKEKSLYDRLGGAEGISSIVDDIVQTHMENSTISSVFLPLKDDPAHFELFKKHVREFLASGTGGSETYTGGDMPSVHHGMNVSEKEYLAVVDDIMKVLNEHNLDVETQKDMLFILYSLKGQVVGL